MTKEEWENSQKIITTVGKEKCSEKRYSKALTSWIYEGVFSIVIRMVTTLGFWQMPCG